MGGAPAKGSVPRAGPHPSTALCKAFHPHATGHIKEHLWKVIFFPKPEKFSLRAQTFSSLFRNNKSSRSWYRIKAPKLNSPEKEAAAISRFVFAYFFFFIRQLKKGPPDWPSGLEVWSGACSREETAPEGFWAWKLKIFG